jgi:hypothetical protein
MVQFLGLENSDYDTFAKENALENGMVSVSINSIKPIPLETVYDFTTHCDNHSFVA